MLLHKAFRNVCFVLFFISSFNVFAAEVDIKNEDIYAFKTTQQEILFKELIFELRCPKCQNQNLMDSSSEISQYMKNKIYKMVIEGKNKQEIVDQLRLRYGDFITYKPPFNIQTATLWLVPLLLFLLSIMFFVRRTLFRSRKENIRSINELEKEINHDDEFSLWLESKKKSKLND